MLRWNRINKNKMKYSRNCPDCGCEIIYSTKYTLANAIKWNSQCRSCRGTSNFNKMHNKMKSGELDYGFTNKCHTFETRKKNSDAIKLAFKEGRLNVDRENNGMYGKHIPNKYKGVSFDEQYGKDRSIEIRKKISKSSAGENNPMYGKPSPSGSGNGWSGWYKGWFFRSLLELSYMVNVIDRFNLEWTPAECKKYRIEYISYDGNSRTYCADFIIADKYMVECKPKKLWKSKIVKLKKEAALVFCKHHNLIYKIVDVTRLDYIDIKTLYENNDIIFTKRYNKKFKQLSL